MKRIQGLLSEGRHLLDSAASTMVPHLFGPHASVLQLSGKSLGAIVDEVDRVAHAVVRSTAAAKVVMLESEHASPALVNEAHAVMDDALRLIKLANQRDAPVWVALRERLQAREGEPREQRYPFFFPFEFRLRYFFSLI